ncbi:MAG: hypothetical protein JWQ97_854 [Phenylobacterium sp.]|nr:hypothetical protein [Phenylobacterium sp.]
MIPLALALSLFLADQPAAADAPPPAPPAAADAAPAQAPLPAGAPSDDYQFVAWCFGVLSGYVELHDEVMPEVTRIESSFRRPGSRLADDLKVYADQERQARADLKRFRASLTAAEKASLKPINVVGAASLQRGRSVWNHGPEITKARLAQEWMSWTLPKRCSVTADALETRAKLLGASFQANAEPEAASPPAEAPKN